MHCVEAAVFLHDTNTTGSAIALMQLLMLVRDGCLAFLLKRVRGMWGSFGETFSITTTLLWNGHELSADGDLSEEVTKQASHWFASKIGGKSVSVSRQESARIVLSNHIGSRITFPEMPVAGCCADDGRWNGPFHWLAPGVSA
jgi:hypothetical protein